MTKKSKSSAKPPSSRHELGREIRTLSAPPTASVAALPSFTRQVPKGSTMSKESYEAFTNAFSPVGYDKLFGASKEQFEKMNTNAFKVYEEISKFSKDNIEACVAASTIAAKGAENIGKAVMAFTQESMEAGAQVAKAVLGAKTLREAVDLNADFAKQSFDKFVAESTKLSEMTVKVSNEALEPISARVNVAVEKMFKPVAA